MLSAPQVVPEKQKGDSPGGTQHTYIYIFWNTGWHTSGIQTGALAPCECPCVAVMHIWAGLHAFPWQLKKQNTYLAIYTQSIMNSMCIFIYIYIYIYMYICKDRTTNKLVSITQTCLVPDDGALKSIISESHHFLLQAGDIYMYIYIYLSKLYTYCYTNIYIYI